MCATFFQVLRDCIEHLEEAGETGHTVESFTGIRRQYGAPWPSNTTDIKQLYTVLVQKTKMLYINMMKIYTQFMHFVLRKTLYVFKTLKIAIKTLDSYKLLKITASAPGQSQS